MLLQWHYFNLLFLRYKCFLAFLKFLVFTLGQFLIECFKDGCTGCLLFMKIISYLLLRYLLLAFCLDYRRTIFNKFHTYLYCLCWWPLTNTRNGCSFFDDTFETFSWSLYQFWADFAQLFLTLLMFDRMPISSVKGRNFYEESGR